MAKEKKDKAVDYNKKVADLKRQVNQTDLLIARLETQARNLARTLRQDLDKQKTGTINFA